MNRTSNIFLAVAVSLFGAGCANFSDDISARAPSGVETQAEANAVETSTDIVVAAPISGQEISSPLKVAGQVRGNWYFEGSFPIRIVDANELQLGTGSARIVGDWGADSLAPFTATITFSTPKTAQGTLILMRNDQLDVPSGVASIRVPVKFAAYVGTTMVKVFFENEKLNLDPTFSCLEMHPVARTVTKTLAVGRAALDELLKGPTAEEQLAGYRTSINRGVVLKSLTIVNGLATADFDNQIQYQVGGSCRVTSIRQQIIDTLKQFPTVQNVKITVNGQEEDVLQP